MRNNIFPLFFCSFIFFWSHVLHGEAQTFYSDTCTIPSVGQSSTSCSLSSSIGGSNSLSYTRHYYYGGIQQIQPDGVTASGRFAGLTASNVRYGILFDTFQLFESPSNNLQWSVSSTNSTCPGSTTFNWLLMRYRTNDLLTSNDAFNQPMDFASTTQYIGGTMSYASSAFTGIDYFDLNSLTTHNSSSSDWSSFGFGGYNSATCSSGTYLVQATGTNTPMDTYGYLYFGANTFIDVSVGGNPVVTLGVPQQSLSSTVMSGLANDVLTGFYTAYNGFQSQDQRTIYFVPNSSHFSGSDYEFDIYQSSTNLNGTSPTVSALTSATQTPSSQTQLGKITCSSLDSPTQGFCSGTLDMSASGISGTGNAVCEFYTGTTGHIIACSGQYPSNHHLAVSFVGQTPSSTTLSNILANTGIVQMTSSGSTTLTATLTNLTGRPVSTLGNPSDLGESSSLDLSTPFTKPSYAGGTSCGTTLAGYSSCTVSLGYSTSSDGASLETFRAAYDSGSGGNVNSTAIVIGTTGLSSISLSSPTMGTSQNITATANFADSSPSADISNAVTWASSNSSVAAVTNDLGNSTNGYTVLATDGIAALTATLGNISFTERLSPYSSGEIKTITGVIIPSPVAGKGVNGTASILAALNHPTSAAVDSSGNVYIVDEINYRIEMIPVASGTYFGQAMTANAMYTIAGSGASGNSGDGSIATSAKISTAYGVGIDSSGNLFIADSSNNRIQMVPATSGTFFGQAMTANYMYTIAGSSTGSSGFSGDGGNATSALLNNPYGVATDSSGNVYIADYGNNRLQMVPASNGTHFGQSMTQGNMYTIVGNASGSSGTTGDSGAATAALLYYPRVVCLDSSNNLYIADMGSKRVRMVPAQNGTYFGTSMTASNIYSIAGGGLTYSPPVAATGFAFNTLASAAVDANGNLYVADQSNQQIMMVPAQTGTYFGQALTANYIYAIAGSGKNTYGVGDSGPATSMNLYGPTGVTVDGSGNVYVVDNGDSWIEMIPAASGTHFSRAMTLGNIYYIAGNYKPTAGYSGDGGAATNAEISSNNGIFVDSANNTYIADTSNNRVRMIPWTTGTYFGQAMSAHYIYTVAGNGTAGATGNGSAATSANLSGPHGVSVDSSGNLYIADTNNHRIQMVPAVTGTYYGQSMTANDIYTVAGTGSHACGYPGSSATGVALYFPYDVKVDQNGSMYIADNDNFRILMVPRSTGTYFGTSMTANYSYSIMGNTWPCSYTSSMPYPTELQIDSYGNLLVSTSNGVMMKAKTSGTYYGTAVTANSSNTLVTNYSLGGIALDSVNDLFFTSGNEISMIPVSSGTYFGEAMTASSTYVIGGSTTSGYTGDGGAASSATLYAPSSISAAPAGAVYQGALYFIDKSNYAVRVIYP